MPTGLFFAMEEIRHQAAPIKKLYHQEIRIEKNDCNMLFKDPEYKDMPCEAKMHYFRERLEISADLSQDKRM